MWQQSSIQVRTRGRGFHELTEQLQERVHSAGLALGSCHLFLRHTSAGLCVTENADPEVRRDLERFAARMAPDGDALFRHVTEGADDMPAHVRTLVMGYELTVPIRDGRLALGTWQGIFLWEHRHEGSLRELILTLGGQS